MVVASLASRGSSDALGGLRLEQGWNAPWEYSLTTLCAVMVIKEMQRRYDDPPRLCFHAMDPSIIDLRKLKDRKGRGEAEMKTATVLFNMLTQAAFQESGSALSYGDVGDEHKR